MPWWPAGSLRLAHVLSYQSDVYGKTIAIVSLLAPTTVGTRRPPNLHRRALLDQALGKRNAQLSGASAAPSPEATATTARCRKEPRQVVAHASAGEPAIVGARNSSPPRRPRRAATARGVRLCARPCKFHVIHKDCPCGAVEQ